ncbi:8-oxo-dGTP diphosphatase [Glutamicibacter soli]
MSANKTHPQPVVLMLVLRGQGERQEVLLGRKLTGFGAGNMVAPGGKIEPGEQAVAAAIRELEEETGLQVTESAPVHRATILFRFPVRPASDMDCQVFLATSYQGEPVASEELEPRWYPVANLPVDHMWQDAEHWLPLIIGGEMFTATVIMAQDNLGVESVQITPW